MKLRLVAGIAALSLCTALAGCTGNDDPGPQTIGPESSTPTTTSAAPSSSTSAAPTTAPKPAQTFPPEQQPIVDAYYGYFDALYSLRTQTDDEVRAVMLPYATPERVEKIVATFAGYRAEGKEPQGGPDYGEITVTVDGTTATVEECRQTDQEVMIDTATGQIVESGSVPTKLTTILELQAPSGAWLVTTAYADEYQC